MTNLPSTLEQLTGMLRSQGFLVVTEVDESGDLLVGSGNNQMNVLSPPNPEYDGYVLTAIHGHPLGMGMTWGPVDAAAISFIDRTPDGDLLLDPESERIHFAAHVVPFTLTGPLSMYDLGESDRLWRKIYASEMETILFSTNSVRVEDGWLIVGHDAGTTATPTTAAATTIDFGKSMTQNNFVLLRTTGQVEYIQVGTVVSGTEYNVTRNLDGSGANAWVIGSVFLVLGNTGDGRIELIANEGGRDYAPRISIYEQTSTYNVSTEHVRIGNMRDAFGVPDDASYWGFGVGDYSGGNYMKYDETGGFELKAGGGVVSMDSNGLSVQFSISPVATRSYKFVDTGGTAHAWWNYGESGGVIESTLQVGYAGSGAGITNLFLVSYAATGDNSNVSVRATNGTETVSLGLSQIDVSSSTEANLSGTGFTGFMIGAATSPSYMLEVVGDGYFSTMLNVGQGLHVGNTTTPIDNEIRADGNIKSAVGISSGSLSNAPTAGEIWSTGDALFNGGVAIGTNATSANPATGMLSVYGGLHVGATAAPVDNQIYAEGDVRLKGGLTVGNITTNMGAGQAYFTDQIFVGANVSNAFMTNGVTIYQGTADDEILSLKASEVAHGMTAITDTNTYGMFKKQDNDEGALAILGLSDSTLGTALWLKGAAGTQYTGKSNSSTGIITIQGMKKSGTGLQASAANGNILVVSGYSNAHMIVDEDGEIHSRFQTVAGDITDFADDYDDMALLNGFRRSLFPTNHELRTRFGVFIDYAKPILKSMGVVTYNDGPGEDGSIFFGNTALHMLTIDTLRQFHGQQTLINEDVYSKLARYEAALLTAGISID